MDLIPMYTYNYIFSTDDWMNEIATARNRSWAHPPPPRRFSYNATLNINRGLNIINAYSGRHIASWIYKGCSRDPIEKCVLTANDTRKLSDNDTLFVCESEIEEFTRTFLPHIRTSFVIISNRAYPKVNMHTHILDTIAPKIIENDYLLHWFAVNVGNSTGGYQNHHLVSPFPLGLKPGMGGKSQQRKPIRYFRKALLETFNNDESKINKTNPIFAGYISRTHPSRKKIPSGKELIYESYLKELKKSSYIISPNGIFPDCHRHYEAIGLGVIPITGMNPQIGSHLREGHIIYENNDWNLSSLESKLAFPAPKVNRNMVFEEYWMEHMEQIVGRRLRWWDTLKVEKDKKSFLDDFVVPMV